MVKEYPSRDPHERTARVFLVRNSSHYYLPSLHFEEEHDEYRCWRLPKENIRRAYLTPQERRGGSVESEGGDDDDDDDDNDEEGDEEPHIPHTVEAKSSSQPQSSYIPIPPSFFFDPTTVFPPSYFSSSGTHPPPPHDALDLGPMYQMLGQLHSYRAEDRTFMEDMRHKVDRHGRIIWHGHLGLVNSGLVPPFANHPSYPPTFDDLNAPYPPPQHYNRSAPYLPPHFPPTTP